MTPSLLLAVAAALVLLAVLSAFVSACETALFSLQPQQLDAIRQRRAAFADGLARLMENPRRLLGAVLLADALVNVPLMLGTLAVIETQHYIEMPRWAAVLFLFTLIVFVCDLVPKLIGLGATQTVARLGVGFFLRLMPLLEPVARVLERIAERITEKILPKHMQVQRHLTDEEMETLVELSEESGALHETESEMISEIIKLGDKTAKDCMTPRVEMFAMADDLTNEDALALLRQRRYRRVPVYGETPDDIEGMLDVAVFLRDPAEHYTERLDVPSFVPETMKAITLLKNFLKHSQGMAVVVDEHGGVEGVITLADLVEEIISDAVPQADAKLYLETISDGRLLANGNARLEDIAEELGVTFEDEGLDTIGGLIFNQFGHLPKPGDELRIGTLKATVRRVSRKRIEEVLLVRDGEEAVE